MGEFQSGGVSSEQPGGEIADRKATEQRLALFQRFVEASAEGMGWTDLDGLVRYVNPALCQMLGEERPKQIYGKPIGDYYSERVRERLREEIFSTILKKGVWTGDLTLRPRKGTTTPTANSFFILRDAQGTPIGFANVFTDLTQRKRTEDELRRHRDHLAELVAGRTQELRAANRELEQEIAVRERAERTLQSTIKGTSATTGEDFFRSIVRHLAGALGLRYALIGELVVGEGAVGERVVGEGVVGEGVVGERASGNKIRTLAVWNGRQLGDNFQYDLAGTPCENVVGKTTCWYPDNVQSRFPDDKLLSEMNVKSYLGTPLVDLSGQPMGILVVLDDKPLPNEVVRLARPLLETFAVRATAELERIRAEKDREKLIAELEAQNAELDRFTYSVSHDLKSPLITIKGFSDVLKDDLAAGNARAVEDDLRRIGSAAEKMARLLDELLKLSRIGRLVNPPQNVDFGELAHEVVEHWRDRIEKRGLVVEIASGMPVVFGDHPRLLEMMRNLIDNAIKYLGPEPYPRVEIGHRLKGNEIVCYVCDNGIGIEPAQHANVFGLFEQIDPKNEGMGVGLSVVKRIVEVHGGRVWVESEGLGQGASFCFTMPTGGDITSSSKTEP